MLFTNLAVLGEPPLSINSSGITSLTELDPVIMPFVVTPNAGELESGKMFISVRTPMNSTELIYHRIYTEKMKNNFDSRKRTVRSYSPSTTTTLEV